jgi:O-antigen/teichoic acid export membrane protein
MLGDFAVLSLSENGFVLLLPLLTSFSLLGQVKAAQVANGPLNVLTAAVALAGLPVLARRRAIEGAVPLRAAVVLAGGLATVAACYGVVLLLLPPSWGQLAFGDSWVGVGILPALIAFQYAVLCCNQGALMLLRAVGEVRRLLVGRIVLVPIQLGLPLLAAWSGGVTLLGASLIVVAAVFGAVWWVIAVRTARSTVGAAAEPQPASIP